MRTKKYLINSFLIGLLSITLFSLQGQTIQSEEATQTVQSSEVFVDEDIIEAEIVIRVPESSIQPRTRTEEIDFTLNYLGKIVLESNKELF